MQTSTKPYLYYEQIINGLFNIPKNIQSYLWNVILVKNEGDRANLDKQKIFVAPLPIEQDNNQTTLGSSLFGWFSKTTAEAPPPVDSDSESPSETSVSSDSDTPPGSDTPSDSQAPSVSETPHVSDAPSDSQASSDSETLSEPQASSDSETLSVSETPPETNETPPNSIIPIGTSELESSHDKNCRIRNW